MTVVEFVLVRCETAQAGVASGGVVAGEPLEHRPARGGAVGPSAPVDEFSLEAGEEHLGHRVVRR